MKHAKVTLEHKKKAVEIALEGGDPLKYLKDHGAGNAPAMWYTIKQNLKETDPEKFSRLPDMRANGNNRKKPETIVKDGVEYEKAEETTLADAMKGMNDAAEEFFGACDEMGLKTDKPEKSKITQPAKINGMIVREVEGKFGRYRYSDIGGKEYIDFESNEQLDVLSLTVEQWKKFRKEQQVAAITLGVEL